MRYLLLLLPLFATALSKGMKCEDHPAYKENINPVFVYSFNKLEGSLHTWMNYHPRYKAHHWAPVDFPSSKKYFGLDWFWANGDDDAMASDAYIRLHFQRSAKAYLAVVPDHDSDMPDATLPGWDPVGYAERENDDADFVSGVYQNYSRYLPSRVFIFQKQVNGRYLDLPEQTWIKNNVGGITSSGYWYIMLAEPNGDAPEPPMNPEGIEDEIVPNKKCPEGLHDLFMTSGDDKNDPDTNGKKFRTSHPMWDPCFWCGYPHDHGSLSKMLMDYEPKFGYVPWKNGREEESHEGFKGHVFKVDNYLIYYALHIQTSSLRRVDTDHHTIIFVVVDAETKELLAEISHKGFFGFLAARTDDGFVALTPEGAEMEQKLEDDDYRRNKRSINVIDMDNLDPQFKYRDPVENILHGEYEEWTTGVLCGDRGRGSMITVDTTNPILGMKSFANQEKVQLGFNWGDEFKKHDGSSRIIRIRDFRFGEEHCIFKLADVLGGMSKEGYFYTNARGNKLLKGPGPDALRQFIKPGFKFEMSDSWSFDPIDAWVVEYGRDADRGVSSYGFVINPEIN